MDHLFETVKEISLKIRKDIPKKFVPPSEGTIPSSELIIPFSMVKDTRRYIEKVVHQINGSYEKGWYDCCAVMIRRLLETLIIECFEVYKIEDRIKRDGQFLYLSELIAATQKEASWTLSRNTNKAFPKFKNIGDCSAHNRRYNAYRNDIDNIQHELRVTVEELLSISKLKK